jgi:hypothetical protein
VGNKVFAILNTIVYTFVMKIEWNEDKNKTNIHKHGIDFHDAWRIFNDYMLKKIDDRYDYGEQRRISLGQLYDAVVVMVYTIRNNSIRIISIRRANRNERKIYKEKFNEQNE